MAAKPSESQLKELMQRFLDEWRSEEQIYKMFVKKWWIPRDEEIEKRFEQERTPEQEEQPTPEAWPSPESWPEWETINWVNEDNDLTQETSIDDWEEEIDRSVDWMTLLKDINFASSFAKPLYNALAEKFWWEAWKIMVQKVLWKMANWVIKSLDWLEKFVKTPWAIQTVVNTVLSVMETNQDMKKWLTKNDAISTASDFADNFLLNIPSFVTHATWHTPYWENKTKWEQKEQVEQMNKDKETREKYSDMWWGWFWNLLWTSKTEWWYLEEVKNIKNKFWWNAEMWAEQQLSMYAADNKKLNDSKLKKDIINKWYKFKTVKDKNTGETYQTWVNDKGKTLLNKSQIDRVGKKDYKKEWETINV